MTASCDDKVQDRLQEMSSGTTERINATQKDAGVTYQQPRRRRRRRVALLWYSCMLYTSTTFVWWCSSQVDLGGGTDKYYLSFGVPNTQGDGTLRKLQMGYWYLLSLANPITSRELQQMQEAKMSLRAYSQLRGSRHSRGADAVTTFFQSEVSLKSIANHTIHQPAATAAVLEYTTHKNTTKTSAPMKQETAEINFAAVNQSSLWYISQEELDCRRQRFPSVEDRVKLYMSNWYTPPCTAQQRVSYRMENTTYLFRELAAMQSNHSSVSIQTPRRGVFHVDAKTRWDRIHFADPPTVQTTATRKVILGGYAEDAVQTLLPRLDSSSNNHPALLQFGDSVFPFARCSTNVDAPGSTRPCLNAAIPVFMKVRPALSPDELHRVTGPSSTCHSQSSVRLAPVVNVSVGYDGYGRERLTEPILWPIVWKLNTRTHYSSILTEILQKHDSIPPWSKKKNQAVFRGSLRGPHSGSVEACYTSDRCTLVYQTRHSSLVDAHITNYDPKVPDYHFDENSALSVWEQLRYKAVIIVEGKDVATGLKWALLSDSVVLMKAPTITSWAMEELLVPWKHYVPIEDDRFDDVEVKMQWILDHPEESQAIARAATLWVLDMLFHPDAVSDEEAVFDEVWRRYQGHFVREEKRSGEQ